MDRLFYVTVYLLLLSACTPTPDKFKDAPRDLLFDTTAQAALLPDLMPGQSGKMQALATANVGVPAVYVDPQTGETIELLVKSEYFSANGRNCRRFTELSGALSRDGVSCQDARDGWVELPLADTLR